MFLARGSSGEPAPAALRPVHREPHPAPLPVVIEKKPVLPPEPVEPPGDLPALPAVLLDEIEPPFLEPGQRLQSVGRLLLPQRGLGQGVQLQPEPQLGEKKTADGLQALAWFKEGR